MDKTALDYAIKNNLTDVIEKLYNLIEPNNLAKRIKR